MSLYRTLLAAIAAIAIASPVFAEDTASAPAESTPATATAPATENSSATQPSTSSEQSTPTEAKVDINKAKAKDLMKVKGVNAAIARALVACRNKQDDKTFKSLDDISKCKERAIKKIKADDLKAIEDQLTVE